MKRLALFALILALGASPVFAQSVADVNASIETVLGDPAKYGEAFEAIQAAVGAGEAAVVADWVSYPITVREGGDEVTIEGPEDFIAQYDQIITDAISQAVVSQKYEDLFVNADGVMFGNGEVWLNGICKDDACSDFDVKIVTIQSTAD
ncbi:hypothetical protein [Devosia sp.]|uniref:hypothetical protein n=1 Tax=Devosia sp. TaxID=1871048 RepID=UPI003BAD9545